VGESGEYRCNGVKESRVVGSLKVDARTRGRHDSKRPAPYKATCY
jgi:hypothetical protein